MLFNSLEFATFFANSLYRLLISLSLVIGISVTIKHLYILIVSHSAFSDNDTIDPVLAWITIEKHKELWLLKRRIDYLGIISYLQ